MQVNSWLLYGLLALIFIVAVIGYVALFRMYNSPDGERLMRQRADGPFRPLSAKDIAEDEARAKK